MAFFDIFSKNSPKQAPTNTQDIEGQSQGINMTDNHLFTLGGLYPPVGHRERVDRYKKNEKIFRGLHFEVFKGYQGSRRNKDLLYISANLSSVICKKSADFLFGEEVQIRAGKADSSTEQQFIDRTIEENHLNILCYESALANAYRGDSFIKVRYGQEYAGEVDKSLDPFRVIVEHQNPVYVFPETSLYDRNKILAYHVAVPVEVEVDGKDVWQLFVESHYAGRIEYRVYNISPLETVGHGSYYEIVTWTIIGEIEEARSVVKTGIAVPLIVHIPNCGIDSDWAGLDDLTENMSLLEEINNRLTQIADILDKHSDPAILVPAGTLEEDADGNPAFNVQYAKVFESGGKEDVVPQYITWDGQLTQAFSELEKLIDLLLSVSEIPAVALGKTSDGGGTSGTSGLAIKWRMNSLLAKINRKRQYYTKGLKQVFAIAQMLEKATGIADYEQFIPHFTFKEGLPTDATEEATRYSIRTGGAKTISQKTAIMEMEGYTEEQADLELERIKEEEELANPPISDPETFNHQEQEDPNTDINKTGTKKPD